MRTVQISYDESFLLLSGQNPADFEKEARFLLVLKLFELHRLSAGKASEWLGLNKLDFLYKAKDAGVPVTEMDEDELDAEFKA